MTENVHPVRMSRQAFCSPHDVAAIQRACENVPMTHTDRPPHYIRQWRQKRGKTLEWVAENIGMSHQNLGKIERFKVPYNQDLLEALAVALQTTPGNLITRNPETDSEDFWDVQAQLKPAQRVQWIEIGKTLAKTGTEG